MATKKDIKGKIIKEYQVNETDTGSSSVQVALLTERIKSLSDHLKTNNKDNHSRRGLLHLVNQRRKLLNYIKRKNEKNYSSLVKKLKLKG